jgi:hypothetical protein
VRFFRPLLIALFVFLMAVTPLSAITSGGVFEIWLAPDPYTPPVRVVLKDHTGLVKGLGSAPSQAGVHELVSNRGSDLTLLTVALEGSHCDYMTRLTLYRSGDGFVIRTQADGAWCVSGLVVRELSISLWAPVDASLVVLESD